MDVDVDVDVDVCVCASLQKTKGSRSVVVAPEFSVLLPPPPLLS